MFFHLFCHFCIACTWTGLPFACTWTGLPFACIWTGLPYACIWTGLPFACIWQDFHLPAFGRTFICLYLAGLSFACIWQDFHLPAFGRTSICLHLAGFSFILSSPYSTSLLLTLFLQFFLLGIVNYFELPENRNINAYGIKFDLAIK